VAAGLIRAAGDVLLFDEATKPDPNLVLIQSIVATIRSHWLKSFFNKKKRIVKNGTGLSRSSRSPMLTLVGQTILSKSLPVFISFISIGLPHVLGSANASLTILSISGFVTPSPDSFLGIPSDALRSST